MAHHAYEYTNSASKAAEILGHLQGDGYDLERANEKPVNTHSPLNATPRPSPASPPTMLVKEDVRVLPLSALAYFLCVLTRLNIGNAKVLNASTRTDMLTETGTSDTQYAEALTLFLLGGGLFAIPSVLLLQKIRPSRWLALTTIIWGAISMCQGVASSFAAVAGLRFLLGVFQAGVFTGLVYYLTLWYTREECATRVAALMISTPLAGALGGAIAYAVGYLTETKGVSPWHWLFIIEGAPACLTALAILFLLPNSPERANWLTPAEKEFIRRRPTVSAELSWESARTTLTNWRSYAHCLLCFAVSAPLSSILLFLPTITSSLGYDDSQTQPMTVPPYAVACLIQILTSWTAQRFGFRALHCSGLAFLGMCGFLAATVLPASSYVERFGCLILATAGALGCLPHLAGWLLFGEAGAELAGAVTMGLGCVSGQIVGVWIYKGSEKSSGYPTGHGANAGLLFFVAGGSLLLFLYDRVFKRIWSKR